MKARIILSVVATLGAHPAELIGQPGRPVVDNPARTGSDSIHWEVVEELRLGSMSGGDATEFGEVAALTVDSPGNIYVLDFLAQDVRVFSESGEHLRTVGGRGDGPGEFRRARGAAIDSSDALWVLDVDPPRWTWFSSEGELIGTRPREPRGSLIPWPGRFVGGALVDWEVRWPRHSNGGVSDEIALVPNAGPLGAPTDTIPEIEIDGLATAEPSNRGLVVAQDEAGRIWHAHTDRMVVYGRSEAGDTLVECRLPVEPQPLDVDSVVDVDRAAGRRLAADEVHPYERLVRRIVAAEGLVYVLTDEAGQVPGRSVDIFDDRGAHLGQARLPEAMLVDRHLPIVRRGRLYGVVADDLGVQYVVRWRLDRR